MARWIYSASGIEVSCPDCIELPSGWFIPSYTADEAAEMAAEATEAEEDAEDEYADPKPKAEDDELSSADW